jgi:methylenetetrahydrofolate reductase (NADPH)
VVPDLAALGPEYFSVTYGAGGATRDKTLAHRAGHRRHGARGGAAPVVRGLHARGHRRDPGHLPAQGIRRIVALRGDLPSGTATAGEFRYASELVRFIRDTQGAGLAHRGGRLPGVPPRAALRRARPAALRRQGGPAPAAITQFFFNPDAYFHFVDARRARLGVDVPIVAGIMPFHNYARIAQFAQRDGIEIPRWVALKMEGYLDDTASIRAFGLDVVTRCASA